MVVIISLFLTSCRDPGILPRYTDQPHATWRWNDQAKTYRPPGAFYDDECGVVVEEVREGGGVDTTTVKNGTLQLFSNRSQTLRYAIPS